MKIPVLDPGQPKNGLYYFENQQEAFLVLSGKCRLLVEAKERLLRTWDFFHSPPGTEHTSVGGGDGPCAILMAGARLPQGRRLHYPVSELAGGSGVGTVRGGRRPTSAQVQPRLRAGVRRLNGAPSHYGHPASPCANLRWTRGTLALMAMGSGSPRDGARR